MYSDFLPLYIILPQIFNIINCNLTKKVKIFSALYLIFLSTFFIRSGLCALVW